MACPESLRTQALADGELDPAAAAAAERHVAGCAECAAERARLVRLRTALREVERHTAPAALRARVLGALAAEPASTPARRSGRAGPPGGRSYWLGAASGALAATLAGLVVLASLGRGAPDPLERDLVAAHLRALVSGHAIDVESAERHTVKPWFAGRADVSPPVADFAAEGYPLAGGRIDYVDGARAAVVVYRRNTHLIDVFAWRDAAGRVRAHAATGNGYRLVFWRAGDLAFCAVSDTGEAELAALVQLIRAAPAAAPRE